MTPEELIERNVRNALVVQEGVLGLASEIASAARHISTAFAAGGKLLFFGNGGSAADATHAAAEFVGRFLVERQALPALSLTDNTSALSAISNDYGYERAFARQVEAFGRAGDVAVGISTSGSSANVVAAVEAARRQSLTTIALVGARPGAVSELADVVIAIPSQETPRIQEAHGLVIHLLCELVENCLPPS
jgi:D-sedoheptulose 7-phosphate isomerase